MVQIPFRRRRPYVPAIGGIILALPGSIPLASNYGTEVAGSSAENGLSLYGWEVPWQEVAQRTGIRSLPDIWFDAVLAPGCIHNPGWITASGTRFSGAAWSGIFAIVNSLRVAAGKAPLTLGAANLYSIYGNASA